MNELETKPQNSWIKRNGLWFFPVLIFGLGGPLVCCSGFAFLGYSAVNLINGPKNAAIQALENDPEVAERLGDNLTAGSNIQINDMQIDNNNGSVDIGFSVSGSKESADVEGKMVMTAGEWAAESLVVTYTDGTTKEIGR